MAAQEAAGRGPPATAALALQAPTPAQIDPAVILPPPPAEGSPQQQAELEELRSIQAHRTPERLAQAQWDDAHENASAFAAVIGAAFEPTALPKTMALLAKVQAEQERLATRAKSYFHRARPFVTDPNLLGCSRGKAYYTSYPSGHATMAYTIAPVLEALMPAKAQAIARRADDYAYSRLVCEVHYRSDLRAGQILGTWTATLMLSAPALQADIAAAKQELAAAGLNTP
jgi:acid phosphatase (class A)